MKLSLLGINCIQDLLYHFPTRYEDSTNLKSIKEVIMENLQEASLIVKIVSISTNYGFSRKRLTKAKAIDSTGEIDILWFNQPYLVKSLPVGSEIIIFGKCKINKMRLQFVSPKHEIFVPNNPSKHLARLAPIYPETLGINSKWIRNKIDQVLKSIIIIDPISIDILTRNRFDNLKDALNKIHIPQNQEDIKSAKRRLSFDELYYLQLGVIKNLKDQEVFHSRSQTIHLETINKFLSELAFKPTSSQLKAVQEICLNLTKSISMNRLLEGDVGSGKTLVAAVAVLNTLSNGLSSAIMAPTTILAQQHYESFLKFFKDQFNIVLLTTHTKSITSDISLPTLFIGTQALIFNSKYLENIGLVVIDEQHRFGVKQRDVLSKLKNNEDQLPHFLTMTATPIPRTMALTLFGDIEISILSEMPKGRIPVETLIIPENKRVNSYSFVKDELKKKNQAFVICPLIEESIHDKMKEVKNATHEFENIQTIFKDFNAVLLHGKMKEEIKSKILEDFRNHKYDILVSTSVVEVGIDIPNATIIMIESSERFGLAQLHQLRGRVGRNSIKSYCLLYKSIEGQNERLKYFSIHNKGLDLAEFDLQNRGPGEVYGYKQSGIPNLKIANILDIEMVKLARQEAINTLQYHVE